MAKIKEKYKAIEMRKNGFSIGEISKKLNVSKSTASVWCRDIVLSETQMKTLENRIKERGAKALFRVAEKKREERIKRTQVLSNKGKKDVGSVDKRDLFMAGLALYWGGGYKKGSQEFGFTNSDPVINIFIIKWLQEIYGIEKYRLILRVSINEKFANSEKEIINYWCKKLGIRKEQFTKTSFIKTKLKKIFPNNINHYGTLRIKVSRGTDLRRRILGSIEALGKATL